MNTLSRRSFLQTSLAAGVSGARETRRPNLVFIIADQHSGLALGCGGHPFVRTPRLDSLAKQGVLFTHAYSTGVICAPSRASLDTGLHVPAHGVRTNGALPAPGLRTIFQILGEHDYLAPKRHSEARGKAYLAWLEQKGYRGVTSPIVGPRTKARLIPTPYRFETGCAGVPFQDSLDAYSTRQAIDFMERNRGRRFGVWLQLHGAHDPFVATAPFDSMYRPSDLPLPPFRPGEYDTKPPRQKRTWRAQHADQLNDHEIRTILAHYLGMVSQTDTLVGQFLDRLSALGLDDNTVVVYTADHGDTMGYHRMFTKGFGFYEPAVRIPLIIRAPGFPRGARVDAMVSGVDVLPTVLETMSLPCPRDIHGRSLVPLWRGKESKARDAVFATQDFEGLNRMAMLRTGQWKFGRYDDGGGELYDLTNDPNELQNLAGNPKYADVERKLVSQLEDWDRSCPHSEPRFSPATERADPQRVRRIREAFAAWKLRHANTSGFLPDSR